MALNSALHQAWPPFVLVSGLLLVGVAAHADGVFVRAGLALERVPGPPAVLLGAGMALVAVTTAVLNLDTSVVFLTPILVHAARARGLDEEPFLFASVFLANASSLYLPGSNLTNLLVLAHEQTSGAHFASEMFISAAAATLVTAAGVLVIFRRRLASTPLPRPNANGDGHGAPWIGAPATIAAAALTVALRTPALAVLGVGAIATVVQLWRRRLRPASVIKAVGPTALAGLFGLSVALGVVARRWGGPAALLAHAGGLGTAAIGAAGSVLLNNLPAAVLLSARAPADPRALLIGLDLGPNLAVTGALSAYLWWKAARQLELRPSIAAFSRRGILLAPAALATATLLSGAR